MNRRKLYWPAVAALTAFLVIALSTVALADVWTDEADYAPGATVYITGNGMEPGEAIAVEVSFPDGSLAQRHEVTANEAGSFADTYVLPPPEAPVEGTYFVLATGLTSGTTFTATFTDHTPVPTNLAAIAVSATQVALSWDGPMPAAMGANVDHHYHIERCAGAGCTSFAEIATTSTAAGTPNTYTDTVPSPGTYRYRIRFHHHPTPAAFSTYSSPPAEVTTVRTTSTSVSCTPDPVPVNAPTTCTATVMDTSSGTPITPGGASSVSWSSSDGSSGFSTSTCTPSGAGATATCQVDYTPAAGSASPPDHTITATYAGDANHTGSNGSYDLEVTKRTTSTSVSCTPDPLIVNGSATCTATVTDTTVAGTALTPGGADSVSWTTSGSGTFTATTCTPSGSGAVAACSVTYTATAVGSHIITAAYAGDADHLASSGNALLSVQYNFTGFFEPVNNTMLNTAKAGQSIPIKWRITDANGVGIADPSSFVSVTSANLACIGLPPDAVEDYAGSSGLQYLGDGYWQWNWKTPKTYAGQCRVMRLNLLDGVMTRTAQFQFR